MTNRRNVFAAVVVLVASLSTLALAGKNRGKFELGACVADATSFSMLEPLKGKADFAELRDTAKEISNGEKFGTACSTAKDAAACKAKLAKATTERGWSNGSHGRRPGQHFIVATRGDEVLVIDDPTSFAKAAGGIDTPAKAGVAAHIVRGITPACASSVRKVADGYEVHLVSTSCFGPSDELIKVDAKGNVTVVDIESGPPTCVG